MASSTASRRAVAAALLAAAFASPGLAADGVPWHITRGEVTVVCPLTIGGRFEAKTPSLQGSLSLDDVRTASFAGDLTVDLATLDTGIDLRNSHMRDKYLEVGRGEGYGKAILSDIRLAGIDPLTFQGKTTFTGRFSLHGGHRDIKGEAIVHRQGSSVRVEASFPVKLADFEITQPEFLGIGIKDQVDVKVTLVADPLPPAPSATNGGTR